MMAAAMRNLLSAVGGVSRKCLFCVLSFGQIPSHIAFIMDGNRRFAQIQNIVQGSGHRVGFLALISTLQYCYEMGINYVTVYAFSIDNFKRAPEEVQSIMDLLQEKIEELLKKESIVHRYAIKLNFWGNLDLLSKPVRLTIEKAMAVTSKNTGPVLSVCVAYTSTFEIAHAVQESCLKTLDMMRGGCDTLIDHDTKDLILVSDLDSKLYSFDCPDPDIVIRTSGESRLSNFLLWQTTFTHLQNPAVLWPEFSLWHLVWAILTYQKVRPFLEDRRCKA